MRRPTGFRHELQHDMKRRWLYISYGVGSRAELRLRCRVQPRMIGPFCEDAADSSSDFISILPLRLWLRM